MNILLARKYREYLQYPHLCSYLAGMLQNVVKHGILKAVQEYCTKGGHFDCYGLSYSRGGSNRTETLRRNGQANVAQQRNARLQGWQGLAHRQDRVRGVETSTQKSVSEASRVVDLLVSWVAHSLQKKFAATMQRVVSVLLAAYFTTLRNALQHQTTQSNALYG